MGRYQPFNDLPASQFQALVADIEQRGVLLPIIVDEDDKTIDGHQRRRAAAEAGVECPKVVVEGLTEQEKTTLSLTLNLFRRHLSGTERSKALQQLANLGMSTRRMADITGLSKSTVHNDLRQLSSSGQLERPERVLGADGKSRPATMPKRSEESAERVPTGVDPETGEIEAPSGSDQSSPADAAGSGDDEPTHGSAAPSPTPKVASEDAGMANLAEKVANSDDGYRLRVSKEQLATRQGLLLLEPERVVATCLAEDRADLAAFARDLSEWCLQVSRELEETRKLRSVK